MKKPSSPRADEALRGTEALYRFLVESVTDYAIFVISLDGVVVSWNPGARNTFGYADDEVIGNHFRMFFTPEDVAAGGPDAELEAALEDGRTDPDRWHVRKDATRFWGTNTVQPLRDDTGKITGFTKIVRDTTERHLAQTALRESEERFRLLVESVRDYAIFCTSPEGLITLWNPGAEHTFGYTADEILGKHVTSIFTAEDAARGIPQSQLQTALMDGSADIERWQKRKDGSHFFATSKITRLNPDALVDVRGFVFIAHDITDRMRSEEAMRHRALHDDLTGLPNRAFFVEHLQRVIAHARRHEESRFAVLFLDIDNFKGINDTFGHVLADELLGYIARRLQECMRPEDVVARIGGDEFTILLGNRTDREEASEVAERIHKVIGKPFYLDGHEIFATASLGIALGSGRYERPEQPLHDADIAMYEAKMQGRSRHVVFDNEMHTRVMSLHDLEIDLRRALERDELYVEYQPIVELASTDIVGFEALVRWRHPRRGALAPSEFIGIAEDTGLIVPIDRWVLRTACTQLSAWQRDSRRAAPLTMSVNFSGKQFSRLDLADHIRDVMLETGVAGACLKLEITESALMEKSETATMLLSELRALGVGLYIDDFGTGYSSLSYLRRFKVNSLKVDGSFVRGMNSNLEGAEIVRAVVTLAHNLGLSAIAEGIEYPADLSALRGLQCEYGQGFLFSRPVGAEAAGALIAARTA